MYLRGAELHALGGKQEGATSSLGQAANVHAFKPAISRARHISCPARQAGSVELLLTKPVRQPAVEADPSVDPLSLSSRRSDALNGGGSLGTEGVVGQAGGSGSANRGGDASTSAPAQGPQRRADPRPSSLSRSRSQQLANRSSNKVPSEEFIRRRVPSEWRVEAKQRQPGPASVSRDSEPSRRETVGCSNSSPRSATGGAKFEEAETAAAVAETEVGKEQGEVREVSPARVLNGAIVAAESAEEVLKIVDQQGGEFNAVNAATAFHRLGKHCLRLPEAALAEVRGDARTVRLAEIVESFAESWGGFAINNIAWVQANLGLGSSSLMLKVEQRFFEKLPTMEALEVSGVLLALGKEGCLSDESFAKLGRILPAWIKEHAADMQEQSISNLMWPYAKLGYQDTAVFEALAQAAKSCLQHPVSIRGLSTLAWAFAKVEHIDERLFDLLAYRSVQAFRDQAQQPRNPQQAQRRKRPGVPITAQDLANLAWAFGKAFAASVQAPQTYVRDDAWMLEYLSRVPARQMVFECIRVELNRHASQLNDVGLSSLVWGFATARVYNMRMLNSLADIAVRKAPTFSFQALAVTFWAFSTLRHDAPDLFEALATRGMRLLKQQGSEEVQLTEKGANILIMGAAHINASHLPVTRELMLELTAWAQSHTEEIKSPQGLANLAWGLACMGFLDSALLRKICVQMTHVPGPIERELSQLYQADLALRLLPHPEAPCDPTPMDISLFLEECYTLGRLRMQSYKYWRKLLTSSFRNITGLHWDVASTLRELGAHFRLEFEAEDYSVDIALEGQRVAIEVDGPFHFSRNTRRPLGFHVLKQRLLARQGWRVLNVPFFHWNRLESPEEKQAYLYRLLRSVGVVCGPSADLVEQLAEAPGQHIVRMLQDLGVSSALCGHLDGALVRNETTAGLGKASRAGEGCNHEEVSILEPCSDKANGMRDEVQEFEGGSDNLADKLSSRDKLAVRQYGLRGLSKHQLLLRIAEGKVTKS